MKTPHPKRIIATAGVAVSALLLSACAGEAGAAELETAQANLATAQQTLNLLYSALADLGAQAEAGAAEQAAQVAEVALAAPVSTEHAVVDGFTVVEAAPFTLFDTEWEREYWANFVESGLEIYEFGGWIGRPPRAPQALDLSDWPDSRLSLVWTDFETGAEGNWIPTSRFFPHNGLGWNEDWTEWLYEPVDLDTVTHRTMHAWPVSPERDEDDRNIILTPGLLGVQVYTDVPLEVVSVAIGSNFNTVREARNADFDRHHPNEVRLYVRQSAQGATGNVAWEITHEHQDFPGQMINREERNWGIIAWIDSVAVVDIDSGETLYFQDFGQWSSFRWKISEFDLVRQITLDHPHTLLFATEGG